MSENFTIIVSAAVTVLTGLFIYRWFHPLLCLSITPRIVPSDNRLIILGINLENRSKVRIRIRKSLVQILEYNIPPSGEISEWVPFAESAIRVEETPIEWREPRVILESTAKIDPGEMKTVERLYFAQYGKFLHVGVQVQADLSLLSRLGILLRDTSDQWTTTAIVALSKSPEEPPLSRAG